MGFDIRNRLLNSLDLTDEGFSFRKLLSLVVLCLVVYLHIRYVDSTNVLTALLYDFGFIAVLLGLLNLDKFIDAKYGGLNTQSQLPFPNSALPTNQTVVQQPITLIPPIAPQIPLQPTKLASVHPVVQVSPEMAPEPNPKNVIDPNDPNSEDSD